MQMEMSEAELKQLDTLVKRDRKSRRIVAFVSPPMFVAVGYLIGCLVASIIGIPTWFGEIAGLVVGAMGALWGWSRSWISNGTTYACITLDVVKSFLGYDPVVIYGPGDHASYWWENRLAGNTVYLGEVTEPFETEVQLSKGNLRFLGSIRFRASIEELFKFVSGAAAVASDIKGLVIAHILEKFGGAEVTVQDALRSIGSLNESLAKTFKHGSGNPVSEDFEGRFAIKVGDITVEKVEAKGIEETLNAITEAAIIDQIVAQSFGCATAAELQAKVDAGTISATEVRHRRNQALAHSGNLQGMTFEDKTLNLNVTGIDPDLAKAIMAAVPGLAAIGQTLGGAKGTSGGNKPRRKS
jgi:hypothetical protein